MPNLQRATWLTPVASMINIRIARFLSHLMRPWSSLQPLEIQSANIGLNTVDSIWRRRVQEVHEAIDMFLKTSPNQVPLEMVLNTNDIAQMCLRTRPSPESTQVALIDAAASLLSSRAVSSFV